MDDNDLDLEPMNRGRSRGLIIGVLVVAASGAGAYFLNGMFKGSQRDESLLQASTAWNELKRCLVGEGPERGERVSSYVRRIEIGLPRALEDVDREDHAGQWPFRCASYASVMTHALFEAHSDDRDLAMLTSVVSHAASALEHGQLRTGAHDRETYLNEIFELAHRTHLPDGARAHGPLPPDPAHPLSPHETTPLVAGEGTAALIASDAIPSHGLRFILGRTDRTLCEFSSNSAEYLQETHCRSLPYATAPNGIEMLGGDDSAPAVFRLTPATGDPILRLNDPTAPTLTPAGTTGNVFAGWRIATLIAPSGTPPAWHLQRFDHSAAPSVIDFALPEIESPPAAGPQVIGNEIIVAQHLAAEPIVTTTATRPTVPDASVADASVADAEIHPVHLFAAPLGAGDVSAVRFADVGSLGNLIPDGHTAACVGDSSFAVTLYGAHDRAALSFFTHDHGSVPIVTDVPRIAPICRGNEAIFTWIENAPHRWVRQLHCTAEHCTESHGSFPTFVGDVQPVVADLDGKILVLISPGPGRGLQMIYAPISDLTTAPRTVIFDDGDHGGLALVTDMPVFVRNHAAVVLVSTRGEPFTTYAVRIDPAGAFTSVRH